MEGYDWTVAGICLDIVDYILGCKEPWIVARHDIPHHNFVFALEPDISCWSHPPVWRTEILWVNQVICLVGVLHIRLQGMANATHVIVCVISNLMSLCLYAFIEMRVLADIVTYHEESCLYPILCQSVKDKGGGFWNRSVVKGEINRMLPWIHSPKCFGIDPTEPYSRLFNNHYSPLKLPPRPKYMDESFSSSLFFFWANAASYFFVISSMRCMV